VQFTPHLFTPCGPDRRGYGAIKRYITVVLDIKNVLFSVKVIKTGTAAESREHDVT